MIERVYELKLESGKVVTWTGKDGPDAASKYVASHPGVRVIAYRLWDDPSPDVLMDAARIIG